MLHFNSTLLQKKTITATLLPEQSIGNSAFRSEMLDSLPKNNVSEVCWLKPDILPDVKFAIAYQPQAIIIKYYVRETCHRAVYAEPNEPVFKDSCVEFFIDVDNSGSYYNFEFNSMGTCLASFGKDRHNRKKLDEKVIRNIDLEVVWQEFSSEKNVYNWNLTFMLKSEIFSFHPNIRFNKDFNVNFYKCGDELDTPHYLSWNPLLNSTPDFHRPEYFGILKLR